MVADRLKRLREVAGLSQLGLGHLAGLAGSHVGAIERRRGDVEIPTLRALSRVLGCSIGYLAAGEGECPDESTVTRAVARARKRLEKSLKAG